MAVSRVQLSSIKQGFPKYRSMLAGNAAYDPAATWLIQRIAGTGSATTITFSSIPQTYKSLQLRWVARNGDGTDTGMGNVAIQFNGDTGSNYARHYIRGDGATVSVDGRATQTSMQSAESVAGGGTTSGMMGTSIIDIHDYASTTKNKTIRVFDGVDLNGTGRVGLDSGLWISTAAITSITLTISNNNWTTSSSVALYGMVG